MRLAFLISLLAASLLLAAAPGRKAQKLITLSDSNTVVLNMPIVSDVAAQVQSDLMDKSAKLGKKEKIYLVLNSPGGSITDGQAIIETAKGLPQEVATISVFSASMSFIISQYLGTRYAVDSATLMSHPASVEGVGGTIPGSLLTRAIALSSLVNIISFDVAQRAGMSFQAYNDLIQSELWMSAGYAKSLGFVDETVTVKCDNSLLGAADPVLYDTLFGRVKVRWYKCPLVTAPHSVEIGDSIPENEAARIRLMFTNRSRYINKYGVPRLF